MKIYGNYVGTLETVRNIGVRVREVRLYCNSVVVDFFAKKKKSFRSISLYYFPRQF